MKTMIICCLLFILSALTNNFYSQTSDNSGIPHVIAFQGVITENDGGAIPDGSYDVTFSIFDSEEGGTPLWNESHPGYKISKGILSIILGKKDLQNPISFSFDRKLYLDIKINSDINIHHRIELGTTAYSLASDYAEQVDDLSISSEKFAYEAVTDEKIKSVSASSFADVDPDPYSIYWTIIGNIIIGPERNYVGTIEAKDFVLKTFSIERMRFGPGGRVTLGTPTETVEFTVIGKTKFQDTFIKGNLGVGVMPGAAKVHVNSPDIIPFRVDVDDVTRFKINQNGRVEITSNIENGNDDNRNAYPLFINSQEQGIGIKVNGSADNDNNFVSFWNEDGMKGRIEGESYLNYLADPCYLARDAYIIATAAADIAAAAGSAIEPASMIAFSAEVIYNAVIIALEHANLGVTYESSSGDYAEWLEKLNYNESFQPGEIVGIYNGKISKNTKDADQLSCISLSPVILGNKPSAIVSRRFEKTAFLGQVPIKVYGKVNRGDYILPSGLNDGSGIAVAPELMTINEYLNVAGMAWESSDEENLKYINTAIGFDNSEIIKMIQLEYQKQNKLYNNIDLTEKKIQEAEKRLSQINDEINNLSKNPVTSDEQIIKTTSGL